MLGKFITHCEDSLTASVFTHLLHLPIEVFCKILRNACYNDDLPEQMGEPWDVQYFPKWDPTDTLANNTYVEPDAFLRFAALDLIIEAKRWDEGMQDRRQWQKELVAYANEYGEEGREVKILALGGLHGEATEQLTHKWSSTEGGGPVTHRFTCPVIMCRWRRLLEQCQRMRRELARIEYPDSRIFASGRVLDDLMGLFAAHGFSTGRWFADFDFARHRLSASVLPHQQLFRSRSLQLSNR